MAEARPRPSCSAPSRARKLARLSIVVSASVASRSERCLDDAWSIMTAMETRETRILLRPIVGLAVLVATAWAGCGDSPPGRTFYQRNIEPILTQKCTGNTSGCHSTNADDPFKFAAV